MGVVTCGQILRRISTASVRDSSTMAADGILLLMVCATFQDEQDALAVRVSRLTLCTTRIRGAKWRRSRRRRARASHASKRRTLMLWKRYVHGFKFLSCLKGTHANMQCLANEEGYEVIGTWKEGELVLGVYSIIDVLADGRNLRSQYLLYHTVPVHQHHLAI